MRVVERQLDADDIPWAWPDAPEDRAPAAAETPLDRFPDSWRRLDDVEILDLPDPEWLIEGVIERRGLTVLYGPSGSGKTTLVAGMSIAIARTVEWLGYRINHRGASLLVAAEDPSGLKVRVRASKRALRLPLDQPIGVYTFPEPIDLRDVSSVAAFGRFIKQQAWPIPLRSIWIDTYAACSPGSNENSSEDVTSIMVNAQQLRSSLGLHVGIVHHTNAAGSRERGHSGMRGAADTMLALIPEDDVVQLDFSKQRNGPEFPQVPLKLTPGVDGDGCVFRLASDILPSSALSPVQTKVFGILKGNFSGEGATKSEWQRTCQDVAERSFHRACKVLIDRGLVKQVGTHFRVTGKEVR